MAGRELLAHSRPLFRDGPLFKLDLPAHSSVAVPAPDAWFGLLPVTGPASGRPARPGDQHDPGEALLRKSGEGQTSPYPERIHPTGSVTGMPRAV